MENGKQSKVSGILLIDKPKGWTSFDVVARVRGQLKRETGIKKPKVGHTGTLDPLATGLMVVVTGRYTKRAQEFSKLDKIYDVSMILGKKSTTGDAEGEITDVSDDRPTLAALEAVLEGFRGEIDQVPPIYSAIKVNGRRAYDLARKGREVKLEPRKVFIHQISDVKYDYPNVSFTTKVSSGTYIRSLVEDIGNRLNTGAYMSDLRRTEVGEFKLADAQSLDGLDTAQLIEK